jgi:hypothetical protein
MDDKLRQIAPREMTDVKQLQDGLVLVINLSLLGIGCSL